MKIGHFNRVENEVHTVFELIGLKMQNILPLEISPTISNLCSSEKGSPITSKSAAPLAETLWESLPPSEFKLSIAFL